MRKYFWGDLRMVLVKLGIEKKICAAGYLQKIAILKQLWNPKNT